MTSPLNRCPHFLGFFFNIIFLKVIVACMLCVIYVREGNYSNVYVMMTQLVWTICTLTSAVPKRAVEFNHSLWPLGYVVVNKVLLLLTHVFGLISWAIIIPCVQCSFLGEGMLVSPCPSISPSIDGIRVWSITSTILTTVISFSVWKYPLGEGVAYNCSYCTSLKYVHNDLIFLA